MKSSFVSLELLFVCCCLVMIWPGGAAAARHGADGTYALRLKPDPEGCARLYLREETVILEEARPDGKVYRHEEWRYVKEIGQRLVPAGEEGRYTSISWLIDSKLEWNGEPFASFSYPPGEELYSSPVSLTSTGALVAVDGIEARYPSKPFSLRFPLHPVRVRETWKSTGWFFLPNGRRLPVTTYFKFASLSGERRRKLARIRAYSKIHVPEQRYGKYDIRGEIVFQGVFLFSINEGVLYSKKAKIVSSYLYLDKDDSTRILKRWKRVRKLKVTLQKRIHVPHTRRR